MIFPDEAATIARVLAVSLGRFVTPAPDHAAHPAAFRLGREAPPQVLTIAKFADDTTTACCFAVPTRSRALCGLGALAPASCRTTARDAALTASWHAVRAAWHAEIDTAPWVMPLDLFLDHTLWAFPPADDSP